MANLNQILSQKNFPEGVKAARRLRRPLRRFDPTCAPRLRTKSPAYRPDISRSVPILDLVEISTFHSEVPRSFDIFFSQKSYQMT